MDPLGPGSRPGPGRRSDQWRLLDRRRLQIARHPIWRSRSHHWSGGDWSGVLHLFVRHLLVTARSTPPKEGQA